jgi:putative IMPACT (imprinted ancient) family translation regulator
MGQIDSKELTNLAVVVVRYFGGTLLGVPGLINAYKTAASLALQLTPIVKKPVLAVYQIEFDYTRMNDIMMVIKRFGCIILQNETQLFCRMVIGIPLAMLDLCLDKLKDLQGLTLKKN